jgi:hypothetical protein
MRISVVVFAGVTGVFRDRDAPEKEKAAEAAFPEPQASAAYAAFRAASWRST